jgi:hypothetical protein
MAMKVTMLLSISAAALALGANTGKAGKWNQQLALTFSNPVEIPGHVSGRHLRPRTSPILFEQGPAGSPETIYAWFYPGDQVGQFVYPKSEADELVSTGGNDANVNAMKRARVKAVIPTGEEVDTVTVFGTPVRDR